MGICDCTIPGTFSRINYFRHEIVNFLEDIQHVYSFIVDPFAQERVSFCEADTRPVAGETIFPGGVIKFKCLH